MSFVVLTLCVAGLGLWIVSRAQKYGEQFELQIMKRVLLEDLARYDCAVPLRTGDFTSTAALDELLDSGLVTTTDGDSLFLLTPKGRQLVGRNPWT